MVLVDRDAYRDAYAAIREDAARCPVLVLVSSADCDSCCAYRTLRALFKADAVPFSTFPVRGYEDVQRFVAEQAEDKLACGRETKLAGKCALTSIQERMLVLINCGGTENLRLLLGTFVVVSNQRFSRSSPPDLDNRPATRVVVIDSHRPLHLANVSPENGAVLVLRDSREHAPGRGEEDFPPHEEDSADDSGPHPHGTPAGVDQENHQPHSQQQRARGARGGDAASADKARGVRRGRARRGLTPPVSAPQRAARAAYYARGSFYGRPASVVVYDVCVAVCREGCEGHAPLWLAIVGLTDQLDHGRLTPDAYAAAVVELSRRVADAPGADAPRDRPLHPDGGPLVSAFHRRRIGCAQELRLSLLRHWSLLEALVHAPAPAAALQPWKREGARAAEALLAEAGLPLHACRQKFSHMRPELARAAVEALPRVAAARLGLSDLLFWSFTRQHGHCVDLSASDAVAGVGALLEAEGGGFGAAVDALGDGGWASLRAGIDRAKRCHAAVLATCGAALLQKGCVNAGAFRFLSLCSGGVAPAQHHAQLLRHPAAATRLALFVQGALCAHAAKPRKPLVVALPAQGGEHPGADGSDAAAGMVLVVGVTCPPQLGDAGGNPFALAFRAAAEAVRAPFVHDAFDAAVIQLGGAHLGAFLEELRVTM